MGEEVDVDDSLGYRGGCVASSGAEVAGVLMGETLPRGVKGGGCWMGGWRGGDVSTADD